jgi:hypothetical protein
MESIKKELENIVTKSSLISPSIFMDSMWRIFSFPACSVVGLCCSEFLGVILQHQVVPLVVRCRAELGGGAVRVDIKSLIQH